MKPKPRPVASQLDLFQAQFEQLLNHDHPLFVLANTIDWKRFDAALADCYCPDIGAPAKAIRLLVGLHYLKHAFNESDESLLERWVENPYWQHFCGFETMQHEVPLHPTSLTKWRQRVGAEKLAELLEGNDRPGRAREASHEAGTGSGQRRHDGSGKEHHASDGFEAVPHGDRQAGPGGEEAGVKLRQTYVRVAKKAAIMVSRYAHAKQFKRMRRKLKKLRTWLGRVIRDLRRKVPPTGRVSGRTAVPLRTSAQTTAERQQKKLYSLHEPEVMCISKGKAHKRYEFGQKVSVATTNRGNWIVGVDLCQGQSVRRPHAGQGMATVEQTTGVSVTDAYVDKGYRGHDYSGEATVHLAGSSTSQSHANEKETSQTSQRGGTKDRPPEERQPDETLLSEGPHRRRDQCRSCRCRIKSPEAAARVRARALFLAHDVSFGASHTRTTGDSTPVRVV